MNPFYKTYKEIDLKEIQPISGIRLMRVWKEHFLQFSTDAADHYKLYEEIRFPEENFIVQHTKMISENIVLKKSTNEMMKELEELKNKVQEYKEKYGELE